jgi:putative inorganic carbon (hco3(-)) transporter
MEGLMSMSSIGFFLAIIMVGAFFFGSRNGVVALILLRPLCDRVFELGRFDVGNQSISCGAFVNIAVIFALFCNLSRTWQSVPAKLRTIWLPYLFLALIAVTYSPVQMEALRRFLTYFCFFTMFAFGFLVVRSERDLLYFLKMIVLSSVVPVAYGLFQLATRLDLYEDRVRSTFSHPNIFAFFIVIVIGVILFLQSTARIKVSGRYRLFLLAYLLPLVLVLLFTKTRSALISCAVQFLVYGIVYDRKVLVLLLLAPFVLLAVPGVGDRINDLSSGNDFLGGPAVNVNSYTWRRILWESAFTYIWQRPIFGYGLDSFSTYSPEFFPLEHVNGTVAHNVYVQTIFEIGFVGLIGFGLIFTRCFAWLGRFWRFDKRGVPVVAATLIAYLIDCYSDNILAYLTFDWCFWFFLGAIFSQFYLYRARVSDHPKSHHWRSRTRSKAFVSPIPLSE